MPDMSTLSGGTGEKRHLFGPLVGLLLLVAAVALGGLYLWGSMLSYDEPVETTLPPGQRTRSSGTSEEAALEEVSASLDNDLKSLDTDFSDIDKALEGGV